MSQFNFQFFVKRLSRFFGKRIFENCNYFARKKLLPASAIKRGQRERMLLFFKDNEDREVTEDLSSLKRTAKATEIQKKAKKTYRTKPHIH